MGTRSTFNALFLKNIDFPHWIDVDIACFKKKYKKNKKNQNLQKARSWGTKFENLVIFLPINTGLLNTLKR